MGLDCLPSISQTPLCSPESHCQAAAAAALSNSRTSCTAEGYAGMPLQDISCLAGEGIPCSFPQPAVLLDLLLWHLGTESSEW